MTNELPLSIFSVMLIVDLILIAYSLYKIDFDKPITVDRILSSIISSGLSFVIANSILNGNVVQTYVDSKGVHYIPFQSLPLNYFLLGLGVMETIFSILLIVRFISQYFEKLENAGELKNWE